MSMPYTRYDASGTEQTYMMPDMCVNMLSSGAGQGTAKRACSGATANGQQHFLIKRGSARGCSPAQYPLHTLSLMVHGRKK